MSTLPEILHEDSEYERRHDLDDWYGEQEEDE